MSENQPEISDKKLEQVAGGYNQSASPELLKLQDAFAKMNQATEIASSTGKKMSEVNQAIIRDIR